MLFCCRGHTFPCSQHDRSEGSPASTCRSSVTCARGTLTSDDLSWLKEHKQSRSLHREFRWLLHQVFRTACVCTSEPLKHEFQCPASVAAAPCAQCTVSLKSKKPEWPRELIQMLGCVASCVQHLIPWRFKPSFGQSVFHRPREKHLPADAFIYARTKVLDAAWEACLGRIQANGRQGGRGAFAQLKD